MIWLVLHFWILSNTCTEGLLSPWIYFYWGPNPSRADIKMSVTLISAVEATVDVEYHVLSEVPSLAVSVPLEERTSKEFVVQNDIFDQTDYFTMCFTSDTAFVMVLVLLTNDEIQDLVRPLYYIDWGHMYTVIALVGKPSVLVQTIKHLTLKIERHYANNDSIEYTKHITEVILKTYHHLLIPLYGNYLGALPCQGAVLEAADKFGVMYLTRPAKQYSAEHAVPDKLSGKMYLTYRFGQHAGGGKYYIVSQELDTKLDIVTNGKVEPVVLHEIGNRHEIKIEMTAMGIVSDKDVIVIFASQSEDQLSNMVPLGRFRTSYILIVPFGLPKWVKNLITLIHLKVDSGKIYLDGRALVTPEPSETVGEYVIYNLEIRDTSIKLYSADEVKFGCFQLAMDSTNKQMQVYYFDAFPFEFNKNVVRKNFTTSKGATNVYSDSYEDSIWREFLHPHTYNEFEYICPAGFYSTNCHDVCTCSLVYCFFNGYCYDSNCQVGYFGDVCDNVDITAYANCVSPRVLFDYDGYTCENMSETPVYLCFVTEFIVRSVWIIYEGTVDLIDEPAVIEILSSEHTEPYHVKYSPDYVDESTAELQFLEPIAVKIMKISLLNISIPICTMRVSGGISINGLSPVYTVGGNSESPHLSDLLHDRVKYQTCMMTRDIRELQIDIGQMVHIYLVVFYVPDITIPWIIQVELYDTNGSSVFDTTFTHQGVYSYFAVINEKAERIVLRSLEGIFGICEVEAYAEIRASEAIFTETVDESMSTEPTLRTYVEDEEEGSALLNYTLDFIKVLFWLSFILIVCFVVDSNLRRRRKQKAERVVKE